MPKEMRIKGLPTFGSITGLPGTDKAISKVLRCSGVELILCFALGPGGTNIEQACQQWRKRIGVAGKTEIIFCRDVPEAIRLTRGVQAAGVVAVFWTCAVYYDEFGVFFNNPDTLPFLFQQVMPLDEMQLCTTADLLTRTSDGEIPGSWSFAAHRSPRPLAASLGNVWVETTSNAQAALLCNQGQVEFCLTTEQARMAYGLVQIHSFGSPPMVFFGGVTGHEARILRDLQLQLAEGLIEPGDERTLTLVNQ